MANPTGIVGQRIHHGLSLNPTASRSMTGDFVTVQQGVFPLLYQKRTGRTMPVGTRLPIKRLLRNVPELGTELLDSGFADPATTQAIHAVVADATHIWSVLGLSTSQHIADRSVSAIHFDRRFEAVSQLPNWRDVFAVSRRFWGHVEQFYEGRRRYPVGGGLSANSAWAVCRETWSDLSPLIEEPSGESDDFTICPSLFKARRLFVPSSLARYVLMFYASSLVRYKPSQLDRESQARQAWLIDSFANQSPIRLVRSALCGIERKQYFFYPAGTFRL